MNSKFTFKNHDDLRGQHALFSPSQSAWIRYDDDKIADKVRNQYRAPLGTEIHEFAATQIELKHKISSSRTLANEIENYIFTKYKFSSQYQTVSNYAMKMIDNVGYLEKDVFETVKHYVNDAIGFRMVVEQPLVYSDKIFGTADSIIFRENGDLPLLRIHDLKTGLIPAHMEQLMTYAALFCLEYDIRPSEIGMELRLYQLDGIVVHKPTVEDILPIMDRIITTEKIASKIEREA